MKCLVLIKEVPSVSEIRIDPSTHTIDRENVSRIINPADLHAVEAALTLASAADDEVTAITMGPDSSETILREVLGMGVKRAFRITDPQLAGADTLVTARALAAAAEQTGPYDAIFCGARSVDGATAQIPGKIGALAGVGILTQAAKMEIHDTGLTIMRKAGAGYEQLSADFPLICSVTEDLNKPRGVNIKGKLAAKKVEIPVLDAASLGLSPEQLKSPSQVLALFPPIRPDRGVFIQGNDDEQKAETLTYLLLDKNYF